MDEFRWIDRLRPLTRGDPRALDLRDDAAVLPSRPGFDLVISTDAMVEGVHFLSGEATDIVARRLLRTSLSDLAAKAAEPFGYFLNIAWPARFDDRARDRFIEGLDQDGRAFGVALLGGDTVSTSGPLAVSATVLGWAPAGRTVTRGGARAGDFCVVCGTIGDGWLGLRATFGDFVDSDGSMARRYRLPQPLFELRSALREHARAAADVSDGLLADAMHIARASGLGLDLNLDSLPLSDAALVWLRAQPDSLQARVTLATGGDDYAIVCAVDEIASKPFLDALSALQRQAAIVGTFNQGDGLRVLCDGQAVHVTELGFHH